MDHDDHEPVFVRSRWGTNRYVYNHRNPVGAALMVISLGFAVVMMVLMEKHAGPFATPEPSPWSPSTAPLESWPSATDGAGSGPTAEPGPSTSP